MNVILAVGAAIIFACPVFSHAASKASYPLSSHRRTCYAKLGKEPGHKCKQLAYLNNFPIGYESVIAKTDQGDFTVSGKRVNTTTLVVSGVYFVHPMKGKGKCNLKMSSIGRISQVDCRVETDLGLAILKSTGDDPGDIDLRIDGPIRH